ncbi:type-F conjugative transfer system secretin TraK [Candidatus Enterovibrio escicola]|uniref:Plasmid conjugative transfer pilus assembly protein TraK n=1 Tax=Candidatus Enterovibrio escicola TaxID=1927127 RepID=A0A2A5T763_9GAMM|nr:type-F conjugative transfer system secretin TraK [Candidatus Enterovibrio escacola]PCS24013.1 plasmid conjugative transfer pilus assembly protein TraK [Candidatus Enterovibrio escacola]
MNKLIAPLVISLMLSSVNKAHAAQEFRVKDGDTVTVKISSRELTRITVDGEGRLDKVWGASGVLEINPDKENGEIFVRPLRSAPTAFSFFVRDDLGATYTIVAKQHDIPSETVLLKTASPRKNIGRGSEYRSTPYIERVKRLMKGMALGEDVPGYTFEDAEKKVPLWAETNITLRRVYTGYDLLSEIYTLENISDKEMVFNEREFLDFGDNVKAVALEQLSLAKGETTFIYVVRQSLEAK